jgi:hypothetical protein
LYGQKNKHFINNIKYTFSSFDNYISLNQSLNDSESFHTYYTNVLNDIKEKTNWIKKIGGGEKKFNKKNKLFILMTCRHIDYSFKIHLFSGKKKDKKYKIESKYLSFICEDFVSSCCCVSSNHFIIGLKNGKLIYYSLKLLIEDNKSQNNKTKNKKENIVLDDVIINVKLERYIQGHKGKINVIEIDKRIGVVITSGDDNYIFIRKLYDFELLLPIKIKSKYIVLMCKISSYNFLYVLCYNKTKNKSVIFGYTLGGLKFAKSEYGFYYNISFTGNGNIVTMNRGEDSAEDNGRDNEEGNKGDNNLEDNKEIIITLSGSDLSRINIDEEEAKTIKGINNSNWAQFDCFLRKFEHNISKIITFFSIKEKNKYMLNTLDVNSIKYFD